MVADKLNSWVPRHPDTTRLFNTLNRQEVRWGLFSGGQVQFTPDARPTDDNDILTDELGFYIFANQPGVVVQKKSVHVLSADGETISYETYEATIELDGKTVQVMLPADMHCSNGGIYNLDMTPLAASRRLAQRVGETVIYSANPFDTVLAKAILQRPFPKQDIPDVMAFSRHYDLAADTAYAAARAEEVRADGRVLEFVALHTRIALGAVTAAASTRELAFA